MREWEKATWATGITEAEVIRQVGQRLAHRVSELVPDGRPILFLGGKGHNGDDARAAADLLSGKRHCVAIFANEPNKVLADPSFRNLKHYSLIVDGLFGIGINRPLNEDWQRVIETVNASEVPVLSVDTPSGLDADTGEVQGAAIRASITLTVGAPKQGLLLSHASRWVGRLEVAGDVGLLPCPLKSELQWIHADDFRNFPPARDVASHKGTYGHIILFAGSLGYHGAAVLAVRGALRAQPGLVTLFAPENVYIPIASQLQAAMVHPWGSDQDIPDSSTAIVFGPGLADKKFPETFKETVRDYWRRSPLPVIVDASALDWLPTGEIPSTALRVITPHPGEAARLLQKTSSFVQGDRGRALRELSARFHNCWVLLKGHHTLIGRSHGDIYVNSSGNPTLAQGGSGDVLAGFLGGLLAQPRLQRDPRKAICYAAWQHGLTADRLTSVRPNWTVEQLVESLNGAL